MDALSSEFQTFLIKLGKEPFCVDERVEHYTKHILHLLHSDEERLLTDCYGLFGNDVVEVKDLARERGMSVAQLTQIIETNLRRLAVSPEWQMVKQLI